MTDAPLDPVNTPDFQAGLAAFGRGDMAAAEKSFRRMVRHFPDHGPSRGNLAVVLRRLYRDDQRCDDEARGLLRSALALEPSQPDAWSNLGALERDHHRLDLAETTTKRSLRLVPGHLPALCNLGNLLLDGARYGEAVACYRSTVARRPDLAEARKNLGVALLTLGDLRTGYQEYEWRNRAENLLDLKGDLRWPRWDGGDLAGRTLLAVTEQGLGDVIHFARYGRLIERMGGRMVLTCQAPLVRLMRRADGVAQVLGQGDPVPAVDVWAPLMSLPLHFATDLTSIPTPIPYIHAEPELEQRWRAVLRDHPALHGWHGLKVGIVWAGNPKHKNDHNRSLPLPLLQGLLAETGIRFVSLQRDLRPGEEEVLASHPHLIHLGHRIESFADTAAILNSLDLVVSVDTSVVHLAGAMGRPVWTLLPHVPDWRWMLGRTDSPWYPGMRLYRQPAVGDWPSVIAEVTAHLRAIVAGSRPVRA